MRPFVYRHAAALGLMALFLAAPFLAAQKYASVSTAPPSAEIRSLVDRVIANQHRNDVALDLFERLERIESRKKPADPEPSSVQVLRVFPAGTGTDHISFGPDGKPADPAAYRRELRKLEKALAWASQDGRDQREAYAKVEKRRKERVEFLDATRDAFLFTWAGREERNGRLLAKLQLDPNPGFKPTSRATNILTKVRAVLWIDEPSAQVARVEAEVAEDVAFGGGILGKLYKGGRFVLEQTEVAPGVWLPVSSQYDFDGRKFLFGFSMHVRTTASGYRRVGPPREALAVVRAELNSSGAAHSDP
jgi:hypothetical protein